MSGSDLAAVYCRGCGHIESGTLDDIEEGFVSLPDSIRTHMHACTAEHVNMVMVKVIDPTPHTSLLLEEDY